MVDLVAAFGVLGAVLLPMVYWIARTGSPGRALGLGALVFTAAGALAWGLRPHVIPEASVTDRPIEQPRGGDTSSTTCRSCHPEQYASWHASYHRTMTTVPSDETVRAPWDVTLQATFDERTYTYKLARANGQFWVASNDPAFQQGPLHPGARRVVLVTGSHHEQFYWYATGDGRKVGQLPLVYSIRNQRWLPWSAVLLGPAVAPPALEGSWNVVCIRCHSTHGAPGADVDRIESSRISSDTFPVLDTRATEFGIACEACHGPAEEHVAANQNPVRRYERRIDGSDPTIVNPAHLDSKRSTDVCGSCHSVHALGDGSNEAMAEFFRNGFRYRPGDDLAATRFVPRYADRHAPAFAQVLQSDPHFFDNRFWRDGMISTNGREMNGLMESKCYTKGELACTTCHQLHKSPDDPRSLEEWADDQLKPDHLGNDACVGCHPAIGAKLVEHTHHPAGSSGSLCYNCHMPNTTYGLLKHTRSHQIDSPSIATTIETGRPNACNLCHLDQSLGWVQDALVRWYGVEPQVLPDPYDYFVSAAALRALKGDAGVRAIVAWNMGWAPAVEASGSDWMVPILATLLEDPYAAVRYQAGVSLRAHPGFEGLAYDYLEPAEQRAEARTRVLDQWDGSAGSADRRRGEQVLIDAEGRSKRKQIANFLSQRDDRLVQRME